MRRFGDWGYKKGNHHSKGGYRCLFFFTFIHMCAFLLYIVFLFSLVFTTGVIFEIFFFSNNFNNLIEFARTKMCCLQFQQRIKITLM